MTDSHRPAIIVAMSRSKRILPLSEQVRRAIKASGRSQYWVAITAGIPRETVSRFLAGKRRVSQDTLDAIGKVLRLRIVSEDGECDE